MHSVDTSDAARPLAACIHLSLTPGGERLPKRLRRAVEWLSGYDLGDVRVHAGSEWPARAGARAFALGTDIHLSPGAEDALPHELWHVVQQKQARVRATGRVGTLGLNDDGALEAEAEAMGSVAERLALWAGELPARRTARFAAIRQPVLQRSIRVGTTAYTRGELDAFTKNLLKQMQAQDRDYMSLIASGLLSEITEDLSREEASFIRWEEAIREVEVRNVGYQAEATMRWLMEQNAERHQRQKAAAESKIEQAEKDRTADLRKLANERRFKTGADFDDYVAAQRETITSGVLGYCKASYMTEYRADCRLRELYRWVLGEEASEPLSMNCWEAVLFALVKSGLADKTYIGWCNSAGNPASYQGRQQDTNFVLLFQHLINDMDGYWGDTDDAFGNNKNRKIALQDGFKPPPRYPRFQVPVSIVIPRGRILMFTLGAHVALSTGRPFPIRDKDAQRMFGTETGHGMLEFDGAYGDEEGVYSIRECAIEDLYPYRKGYLENLVIAPFPRCKEPGTIVLKGKPKVALADEPSYADAKAKFLEANQETIKKAKAAVQQQRNSHAAEIAKKQQELEQRGLAPDSKEYKEEYERLEQRLKDERSRADRQLKKIDDNWSKAADGDQEVQKKRQEAEKKVKLPETISFKYSANDPYRPGQE